MPRSSHNVEFQTHKGNWKSHNAKKMEEEAIVTYNSVVPIIQVNRHSFSQKTVRSNEQLGAYLREIETGIK